MPNAVFLPSWRAFRRVGSDLEAQSAAIPTDGRVVDPATPARDFRKRREFEAKASTSGVTKSHTVIRIAQRLGNPLVDIAVNPLASLETTARDELGSMEEILSEPVVGSQKKFKPAWTLFEFRDTPLGPQWARTAQAFKRNADAEEFSKDHGRSAECLAGQDER